MIKRALWTLSASLALAISVPAVASAHVLKTDGQIGAVLHVSPDDNPTTGTSTKYTLSFSDQSGRFSLSKCDCTVTIIENGNTITTKPLVTTASKISNNQYTFITPDVYDLRISGSPKIANTFQNFTLDYELRVGKVNNQQMPALLWVGMSMGIGLVLLAAYAMSYDDKQSNKEGKL